MKITKKIISSLLCIMLTSAFAFGTYAQELTQEQFAELKEYGIFEGDPDGNLRLEETITRSEAVKMICTAMCLKASDSAVPPFPDVMMGNWAAGWIQIGKSIGIVNGDENGNFRPGDTVTNEEYIKMLICALGYEPMAEQRGGYPAGYIAVANTYGITRNMQFGIGEDATRANIALMTYRGIDVPLMAQTGFGSQVEYTVMDGKNGKDHMTLRKELDPDFVYPEPETDKKEEPKEDKNDMFDEVYSYMDVEISNLSKKDGTYTFTDKKRGKHSPTFVVGSSTYVYTGGDTVPLSALKDGYFAKVLCAAQWEGSVNVLGIEVYEQLP